MERSDDVLSRMDEGLRRLAECDLDGLSEEELGEGLLALHEAHASVAAYCARLRAELESRRA